MNLAGKTILVTRAAHQADEFVLAIEREAGTAIVCSTIEITPAKSWDACDRALDGIYMYDGLIFTSTNGVEFFFQRMSEKMIPFKNLKSKSIFVVGEKTKQTVERFELSVTVFPEKFTGSDLSKKLEQEDLRGKTFLFPRGNLGKDILADNLKLLGANVNPITVYETHKPQHANIQEIEVMILKDKIDFVAFTSPSTFKNFCELFPANNLKNLFDHMNIAVIGPVTARAIEESGYEIDVLPKESTIEALVEAMIHHTSTETQRQNITHG